MTAIAKPITAKAPRRSSFRADPARLAFAIFALGPATAVAAAIIAIPPKPSITFPATTTIVAELDQGVSTRTAAVGDPVTLRTIQPLELHHDLTLPNGIVIHGEVTHVKAGGGRWRPPGLTIHFTRLMVDRGLYDISAVPFRGAAWNETATEISLPAGQKVAVRLERPVTIRP